MAPSISTPSVGLLNTNRDHRNRHTAKAFKFPPDQTNSYTTNDPASKQITNSIEKLTSDKISSTDPTPVSSTSGSLVDPTSNQAPLQQLDADVNPLVIHKPRLGSNSSTTNGIKKVREKWRRVAEENKSDLIFAQLGTPTFAETSKTDPASTTSATKNKNDPAPVAKSTSSVESSSKPVDASTMSLWKYLLVELQAQPGEVLSEERTESLVNFVNVPIHLEKVIIFGTLACLDSFLHFFTILPLRFLYALYMLIKNVCQTCGRTIARKRSSGSTSNRLPMSRKADILKGFIFVLTIYLLLQLDTSKIYHSIRGQSAIKLYVMFSVLEISDKLLSALGQDILECLFSHKTLSRHYNDGAHKYYQPVLFAMLAVLYVFCHSLVILYQIITLNVAVNSYSNALLTLLLSNQFSEIKSAVFKKFERENLFQLTCADITERFQLTAMLFIIGMRNLVEVSNAGLVPRSWSGWNRWLGAMFGPMFVVIGSEICVDWLKHAYISKFNNIKSRVYDKFLDVLTFDYSENALSDYIMTKRMGLPVFPIASVFIRMLLQSYSILTAHAAEQQPVTIKLESVWFAADILFSAFLLILVFIFLFVIKLILGLFLLQYSYYHRAQMASTEQTQQTTVAPTAASASKTPSSFDTDLSGATTANSKEIDEDEADFVPGLLKGGQGVVEIPEHLRAKLYDLNYEKIPPLKPRKSKIRDYRDLLTINRFKMTAKQIW
ncbi:similar to Saccharomyces cerevisiae YER140W EMP65 ER membrane protein of unknown function [Geotrichum candidum]|uniref:DUF747-domain-containing protein n=1 Tax=Geotrichum candidum TaxID=1173061 RepID=A0A0J9X301_GEOCN|nr:similar to Saccharomyces cerevisiae YER140W EMP65 ER membrane protein of unknown function [Geotrichum candidum]